MCTRDHGSIGVAGKLLTITLAVLLGLTSPALAQPPGKGGGGGGGGDESSSNGGGVIYFTYAATNQGPPQLYQMNADGSQVVPLPISTSQLGSPSYKLHAGSRWFLKDLYSYELDEWYTAIVNVDGDVVPLFPSSGEISATGDRQWTKDDSYVSFPGRRFDANPTSPTFGDWTDFGLYMVELEYDDDGYPLGTLGVPTWVFPSDVVYHNHQSEPRSDIQSHSWAEDGLRFVYSRYVHTDRLSIGNLVTQATTDIGIDPAGWYGGRVLWAPGAETVMCNNVSGRSRVITMNVDGSGITEIASSTATVTVFGGDWSPTGSHLVYKHQDGSGKDSRIIRATSLGGSKTRITSRSEFGSGPSGPTVIGWRAAN